MIGLDHDWVFLILLAHHYVLKHVNIMMEHVKNALLSDQSKMSINTIILLHRGHIFVHFLCRMQLLATIMTYYHIFPWYNHDFILDNVIWKYIIGKNHASIIFFLYSHDFLVVTLFITIPDINIKENLNSCHIFYK